MLVEVIPHATKPLCTACVFQNPLLCFSVTECVDILSDAEVWYTERVDSPVAVTVTQDYTISFQTRKKIPRVIFKHTTLCSL